MPWLYEMAGGKPFAFAGLWESWHADGADGALESCTIITTDANELASQVHVRRRSSSMRLTTTAGWLGSRSR